MQAEQLVNQTNLIEELTQRINALTGVDNGDSTDIQTLNQRLNNHTIEIENLTRRISEHSHDDIDGLETITSITSENLKMVNETLNDVKTDVEELMDQILILESNLGSVNESLVFFCFLGNKTPYLFNINKSHVSFFDYAV